MSDQPTPFELMARSLEKRTYTIAEMARAIETASNEMLADPNADEADREYARAQLANVARYRAAKAAQE